ncbi:MAG: hypothetical protein JHC93_01285 [Parachlamydiales bacterium]|nr:hypothetical protein [Parachlamydiales bacterium]
MFQKTVFFRLIALLAITNLIADDVNNGITEICPPCSLLEYMEANQDDDCDEDDDENANDIYNESSNDRREIRQEGSL